VLEKCTAEKPLYEFTSDFAQLNDLHGIHNRVWRVPEATPHGKAIQATLAQQPLYIADGHHRYHAAVLGKMNRFVGYVTEQAGITAYNRVVRGPVPFERIKGQLNLREVKAFSTPPQGRFTLYWQGQAFELIPSQGFNPEHVVERLDCARLEKELYPLLGLKHSMIKDPKHFDYYPEWALADMKAAVDQGHYDLAIALHPVSLDELLAVADAGLENPEIVMPEKSTFFAPKVLSGLFLQKL
jgi:uncharacterized protein (DUF1015 family)